MSKEGATIEIINEKELLKLFKHLETTNKDTGAQIKRVIKAPFTKMRKNARTNLKAQGSVRTGSLERGLSIGSSQKRSKAKFFAFFGGKYVPPKARIKVKVFARTRTRKGSTKLWSSNHFHMVNSGTKTRRNKKGANRGAVGKSINKTNSSFRLGFADKAIKKGLSTIEQEYLKGFSRVYADIIKKEGDQKT